jgi:hypothetical protein
MSLKVLTVYGYTQIIRLDISLGLQDDTQCMPVQLALAKFNGALYILLEFVSWDRDC